MEAISANGIARHVRTVPMEAKGRKKEEEKPRVMATRFKGPPFEPLQPGETSEAVGWSVVGSIPNRGRIRCGKNSSCCHRRCLVLGVQG